MEYHGKFVHNIGRIQLIALMSRVNICYTSCLLETQTGAPTIPVFQGLKRCIQYLASHPHNFFYPYNYYDGSNIIRITWIGNQVEDYTNQNCLQCHKYEDHARNLNIRQKVSGIIHTLLGVYILWKVQIKTAVTSDSTDG